MQEQRAINKLVLQYFNDMTGIPQGFDDVSNYVRSRLMKPSGPYVERALCYLLAADYIVAFQMTAADEKQWKVTASGIRQISRNVRPEELDPMIWGAS